MTTIAEVQALPEVDVSKLAVGNQVVFRGVSNVLLQIIEGQKSFAIGQVYKIETFHNLLGLGHIIKVEGVSGFHFANLFADVPADFVAPTPEETADVVVDAVKTVEADVTDSSVAQTVETAVTNTTNAVDTAATVVPAVDAAVTAVVDAAPTVATAVTDVATATTDVAAAVTAVSDVAPVVAADVVAPAADTTTAATAN